MNFKKHNLMAQDSAETSANHSQDKIITTLRNCNKKEGGKEIMAVEKQLIDKVKKMLVEAYKDMLSDSIKRGKKFAKIKRLEEAFVNGEITETDYIETL